MQKSLGQTSAVVYPKGKDLRIKSLSKLLPLTMARISAPILRCSSSAVSYPSKNEIKRAGKLLVSGELSSDKERECLEFVGFWRSVFIEPLQEALSILEGVCGADPSTVLVSRLKRIDTIIDKLCRPDHQFILTTLYDIAGCRLVVQDENEVRRISALVEQNEQFRLKHDYISAPKDSGYRGIHLVCRHNSKTFGYKNLDVEIQIRSRLQHQWATAVELYDLLYGTGLKFGRGNEDQLLYFKTASDLMYCDDKDSSSLIQELRTLEERLGILSDLKNASNSMYVVPSSNQICRQDSCLIHVDIGEQVLKLEVFPQDQWKAATDKYTDLESKREEGLVYLLARAGSVDDLQIAYPNYYSDISNFIDFLDKRLG